MTAPATNREYRTFWADGLLFGVAAREVQEVLRFQELSAARQAPASAFGLMNLRRQIVTAIDGRHRLGLPARALIEPVPCTLPVAVRDVVTGVIALPAAVLLVVFGDRTADVPTAPPNPKGNP